MNERPTIRQREATRSRRSMPERVVPGRVLPGNANNVAIGITVGMLGIMGVAIAIDASSMPLLALLTILSVGGLIAAIIAWG